MKKFDIKGFGQSKKQKINIKTFGSGSQIPKKYK